MIPPVPTTEAPPVPAPALAPAKTPQAARDRDIALIRAWVTVIGIIAVLFALSGLIGGIVLGAEAAHRHAMHSNCVNYGFDC